MNFETRKTQLSSEFWVWKNIQEFVNKHNICLLDHLLCIEDESALEPIERYHNFTLNFQKHFTLNSRSAIRHGKHSYPFVGVYFGRGKKGMAYSCSDVVEVYFRIVLSSSPQDCEAGCGKCNDMLEEQWFDCVVDSILEMFRFTKQIPHDGGKRLEESNLFEYNYGKDGWLWNMVAYLEDDPWVSEINPREDENLELFIRVPIKIISKSISVDNCSPEEIYNCC